ncbi:P-loop containing nucleoside triphosphate hydrolase [Ilyonectria robusta]
MRDQEFMGAKLVALIGSTELVQDELRALRSDMAIKMEKALSGEAGLVGHLSEKLDAFQDRMQCANRQRGILRALQFDKMNERFEDVKKEHDETFEWIYQESTADNDNLPFIEWLRSGDGVFHVEGKAGSGKSTLMKLICRDARTNEALAAWAGSQQLILGHFFFWKPGSSMQRSLKGLTQSLLYTILEQVPELIESVFPDQWKRTRSMPWDNLCQVRLSLADIQGAFQSLIRNDQVYSSWRFCFFIDGLDEFDESNGLDPEDRSTYADLIRLLSEWVQHRSKVKLCVSSRDWNLFRGAFTPRQKLRLQDLTRNDMRILIQSSLQEYGNISLNGSQTESDFDDLVNQIVEKAEGVFLWVVLVLKSLRQGLQHKDSPEALLRRLETMPRGLENFLGYMLESIDSVYHPQSARIFAVALAAGKASDQSSISLLGYSFLEDIHRNSRFSLEIDGPMGDEEIQKRLERMSFQLDACCKGLLEVKDNKKKLPRALSERVTFLHRSVQDFLEDEDEDEGGGKKMRQRIKDTARKGGGLDLDHLIANSFLAQVQSLRLDPMIHNFAFLGPDLAFAVDAIHEMAMVSQHLDVTLVRAIDKVLRQPQMDISPSFNGIRSYTNPELFAIEVFDTPATITFLDIVSTLAVRGCSEIFTLADAGVNSSIMDRSVSYLLYHILDCSCTAPPPGIPGHVSVAKELLLRNASLNDVMWSDQYWSYTNWELFFYHFAEKNDWTVMMDHHDVSTRILKTLLEYGADPLLWVKSGIPWHHRPPNLVYPNDKEERNPDSPAMSLRQMIESRPTSNLKNILALLPSHEDYDREWQRSRKVSRKEIRRLQGFSGPEESWDDWPTKSKPGKDISDSEFDKSSTSTWNVALESPRNEPGHGEEFQESVLLATSGSTPTVRTLDEPDEEHATEILPKDEVVLSVSLAEDLADAAIEKEEDSRENVDLLANRVREWTCSILRNPWFTFVLGATGLKSSCQKCSRVTDPPIKPSKHGLILGGIQLKGLLLRIRAALS